MNLLTIDTSTNVCSVALTCGERLIAERFLNLDKPLSGRLPEIVDSVLADTGIAAADLDGFGVSLGPGSFTGLRVGVAMVKGLALATGKPVAGFSSLSMLAMNLPWAAHQVCPMFDARKNEVYAGIYYNRDLPELILPDCVLPPVDVLNAICTPTIFIGEGAVRYRDLIVATLGDMALFAPDYANLPRASVGALLARAAFQKGETIPFHSLLPTYIRPSEAELAKMKKNAL